MAKNARAYLDGGPADGTLVELEDPNWAPLGILRVEVDGETYYYVKARQRQPPPGRPWRYVPQPAVDDDDANDPASQNANYDPADD